MAHLSKLGNPMINSQLLMVYTVDTSPFPMILGTLCEFTTFIWQTQSKTNIYDHLCDITDINRIITIYIIIYIYNYIHIYIYIWSIISKQIFQIFHLELRQKNVRISSAGIAIQVPFNETRQKRVAGSIHLCRRRLVGNDFVGLFSCVDFIQNLRLVDEFERPW